MSSMYGSRTREMEHHSASACTYQPSTISISEEGTWIERESGGGMSENTEVPCVSLQDGSSVRVAPMERKCRGWDDEHFHDRLRLPEGCNVTRGLVVMLEAMGRECVAVALSPNPYFSLGKTYVVHFGASGNLTTVLRRRLPNGTEAVDATFPSRVCTDDRWTSYWVVLQGGKLSAGVGRAPGRSCIGTLDDTLYNQLRSGTDAVRYVGIGNSALGRNARDVRVRKVRVAGIPAAFGADGIPMHEIGPTDDVGFVSVQHHSSGVGGGDGKVGPSDAELLAEYERECAKARARAAKFDLEYKEPKPDAFLKWSEARRLRANPEKGFITGIDVTSAEEVQKKRMRKERFESDDRKRKGVVGDGGDAQMEGDEEEGDDKVVDDWENKQRDPLPVGQAWDNEELVREHRIDPPEQVYAKKSFSDDKKETTEGEGENGLATNDEKEGKDQSKDSFEMSRVNEAVSVPEKIHLFAIDWAAFKQIRTPDVMGYFAVYGPSYVEWLGELSCNVLFEDKFSAARALTSLSQEVPSPPPESISTARSTTTAAESMQEETEGLPPPPPDLGGMGWKFCQFPLRKLTNDRYGRRGTTSRVLMRVATSLDILEERPTAWPAPPPGFTTKRVLGPGSDFDTRRDRNEGGRRSKRRRRGTGGRYRHEDGDDDAAVFDDGEGDDMDDAPEEHPALSQGLRSGRKGFSVEEMEAERAAKKAAAEAEGDNIP